MKKLFFILLAFFTAFSGFAQQYIDIVNAPLNPIGYIENKNQLNLKGDIAFCNFPGEGFIYFDKSGQRVFNLIYTLYTNKEKARINKGTYIELDNQKKVLYKENFYLENKTLYTYNSTGTISKIEVQGKYPSITTFEYDNKKRLNKKIEQKDAKTTATTYTYQTIGNRIVISASETVMENNQSKSRTFEYAYENGLLMKFTENGSEDNHTYTYDTKGNWVTNSFRYGKVNREFYYHSELGQWDNWRWIYKKTNTTYSPYLMIGDRQIRMLTIGFNDLDNFTDILFYEPLTATTLVAENAVTTSGLTQGTGGGKMSTMKAKNFMYTSVKGNIKFFVEGDNKSGNLKQVFMGKTYVIYDAGSSLTYWCRDFEKGKKFNVFEDLGKGVLLWAKNDKNNLFFWEKGDYISTSGYTLGETLSDGSKLLYKSQKPALVLENFTTSAPNTFYKAVPYSGQAIPKATNASTTNTAPSTSSSKTTGVTNTAGHATETRYYNGKYTKETALKKTNDFFASKNGEKITVTKMDKKSDYQFIGNWIIKSEAENLQSKIEYLFEDDGLKIKINEIILNDKYGALKMDKNHKDEAARKTAENLYVSINDLFVKAAFIYLGIENNTTPASSSSKTTSVANTAGHTVVKDYSKDKINASYNENTALYARKINDTTVYFYQDNQRINEPLHHVIVSVGTTRRLYCTYAKGKDYYSPIAINEMSTEKLYPLINRKGVNYLYVSKSNSIYNYVYNGKALELDEYEFYKSTGDYSVVKVKVDNTFYTLTNSILENSKNQVYVGNSASKGVLIHQNNGKFVFVEKGFPTRSDLWKIKKENNSYFLVNDMAKRKYSISDYEKSFKWGIHTVY